jgi:hypothetical protein
MAPPPLASCGSLSWGVTECEPHWLVASSRKAEFGCVSGLHDVLELRSPDTEQGTEADAKPAVISKAGHGTGRLVPYPASESSFCEIARRRGACLRAAARER